VAVIARRPLGATGLEVSVLGLGAGPLGDASLDEATIDALVGAALDLGVTLFDTARSYGVSEERLARALGTRRRDVVLATKGGYGVAAPDWSPDAVRLGIDAALERLRTDVLDVFFLHSCDLGTLTRGDLLGEVERAREKGKVRVAGYSGEGDALAWAVRSGRFGVVECSVSPFDQASRAILAEARARGVGVLAKRALANAPWRFDAPPERDDVRAYWDRMRSLGIDPSPLGWPEAAIRFAAFTEGVSSALVGTTSEAHLRDAAAAIARGDLPAELRARFHDAWNMHASSWGGIV
jgi:aryl-alcohol dehydrogenase-like predicted oxidoreductase